MIKNQWYAIMPSNKVKKGNLTSAKVLDMELCLFRDNNGKINCIEDRCSHRGAAISKGKVQGNCAVCPFHGLRFASNGDCLMIPAQGENHLVPERYNVKAYKVKEKHGIIFLWYGDENIEKNIDFFEELEDEKFQYSEMEDHWKSHYSRCIENQLDVVHLPFVHKTTIGRGNKTIVNGPKVYKGNWYIKTCANNEKDTGQMPKTADEIEECKNLYLKFIFPNMWINHINDNMIVMIYFVPVDEKNTKLYIRFYTNKFKNKLVNKVFSQTGKIGNFIIERQDKKIVETQRPYASSLKSGENLISGDKPIIEYRKMREELKKQI